MSKHVLMYCDVVFAILDPIDVLCLYWRRARRIQTVASGPHRMVSVTSDVTHVSPCYRW